MAEKKKTFTLDDFGIEPKFTPDGILEVLYEARKNYVSLRDSVSAASSSKNIEKMTKKAALEHFESAEEEHDFVSSTLTDAWNTIVEKANEDPATAFWFAKILSDFASAAEEFEEHALDSFKSSSDSLVSNDVETDYERALWLRENVIDAYYGMAATHGLDIDADQFPVKDGKPDLPKLYSPKKKSSTPKNGGDVKSVTPVVYVSTENGVQRITGKAIGEIAKEYFGGMKPGDFKKRLTNDAKKFRNEVWTGTVGNHAVLGYYPDMHDGRKLRSTIDEFKKTHGSK